MMQHKLEERKAPSDTVSKQLALLDLLFEHRMQHVDAMAVREEASKCMLLILQLLKIGRVANKDFINNKKFCHDKFQTNILTKFSSM